MNTPQPDIDASLQSGLESFLDDWRYRFVSDEEANEVLRATNGLVSLLVGEATSLSGQQGGEIWTAMRSYLASEELSEDFTFVLQARLARTLLPSFAHAAERCWDLAEIVVSVKPSDQVLRFLNRAARCYLLDLVPECLVMCRGAFENALRSKFRTTAIPYPKDEKGNSSMHALIFGAGEQGWLNRVAPRELYDLVWIRGSKAAHGDPFSVGNALESLRLTMQAMSGLVPGNSN